MGKKSNPMTKEASERIQTTQEKGGKDMSSKGFSARAQSAADSNVNKGTVPKPQPRKSNSGP